MDFIGVDLAAQESDKTVVVVPDDAEIKERNGEVVVTLNGKEYTYPQGTIVFSQSGLKNACDWI